MGNQVSSAVDFVTCLLPEILCIVLSFLPLKDVLKCLRVSKRWRESILELHEYWARQLTGLNLSSSYLDDLCHFYPRKSDVFLEIKRCLIHLQSVEFTCVLPECYPAYTASECFVMPQQNVVVRTGASGMSIEKLLTVGNVIYTQTLYKRPADGLQKIGWAHYSKNNCLYWLDFVNKMGSCCSIVEDRTVHSFNFFNEFCFDEAGGSSAIGERIFIQCCEECSLCVMCVKSRYVWNDKCGKMEGNEEDFDIQIVSLGDTYRKPRLLYFSTAIYENKLKGHAHNIPGSGNTTLKLRVSSTGKSSTSQGICKEHSVLLINNGYVTAIDLQTQEDVILQEETSDLALQISAVCLTCKYIFPSLNEIRILGDYLRTMQSVFFTTKNRMDDITNSSKKHVKVPWKEELLSAVFIGQQLSILRSCKSQSSEHNYWVVHSESGKLYKKVQWSCLKNNFGRSRVLDYLIYPETVQWLHDIRNTCPVILFTEVLCDSNGGLQFLSVQHGQGLQTKKEVTHAVNMCFIK